MSSHPATVLQIAALPRVIRQVLVRNEDLAVLHQPPEKPPHIMPNDFFRCSVPSPNCHLSAELSRSSGPTHEIIGEETKLLRSLQTLKNDILIRIQCDISTRPGMAIIT